MFPYPIPHTKKAVNFKELDSLEAKLKSLYDYLKVETIYCAISNPGDHAYPQPLKKLQVTEIDVPGGTPSFIKSLLNECEDIYSKEIKELLESDKDFDSISQTLEHCIELCGRAVKENNFDNSYTRNEEIRFEVYNKENWEPVLFPFLLLSGPAAIDFDEHFDIRKGFYTEMVDAFSKALEWHLQKPDAIKKPYSWDSKTAELDASELVYLLCKKSELIKYNVRAGGSFSKFKKEFFGLFGLSDKRYDQNVSDILKRKKDMHFVDELAKLMPNTAPEPPETI